MRSYSEVPDGTIGTIERNKVNRMVALLESMGAISTQASNRIDASHLVAAGLVPGGGW